MSRIKYFADHNFNDQIVGQVIRAEPSIDLLQAREIDMEEAPDEEVLEGAARLGMVVLSHDFQTMIGLALDRVRSGKPMPGLFMVRQREPIGPVIEDLIMIWACSEPEEWRDRVVYLPLKSSARH
jgi:hypothetical protein